MKTIRLSLVVVFSLTSALASAQDRPIVIQADTVLDGKGHVLRNTRIVIEPISILTSG